MKNFVKKNQNRQQSPFSNENRFKAVSPSNRNKENKPNIQNVQRKNDKNMQKIQEQQNFSVDSLMTEFMEFEQTYQNQEQKKLQEVLKKNFDQKNFQFVQKVFNSDYIQNSKNNDLIQNLQKKFQQEDQEIKNSFVYQYRQDECQDQQSKSHTPTRGNTPQFAKQVSKISQIDVNSESGLQYRNKFQQSQSTKNQINRFSFEQKNDQIQVKSNDQFVFEDDQNGIVSIKSNLQNKFFLNQFSESKNENKISDEKQLDQSVLFQIQQSKFNIHGFKSFQELFEHQKKQQIPFTESLYIENINYDKANNINNYISNNQKINNDLNYSQQNNINHELNHIFNNQQIKNQMNNQTSVQKTINKKISQQKTKKDSIHKSSYQKCISEKTNQQKKNNQQSIKENIENEKNKHTQNENFMTKKTRSLRNFLNINKFSSSNLVSNQISQDQLLQDVEQIQNQTNDAKYLNISDQIQNESRIKQKFDMNQQLFDSDQMIDSNKINDIQLQQNHILKKRNKSTRSASQFFQNQRIQNNSQVYLNRIQIKPSHQRKHDGTPTNNQIDTDKTFRSTYINSYNHTQFLQSLQLNQFGINKQNQSTPLNKKF